MSVSYKILWIDDDANRWNYLKKHVDNTNFNISIKAEDVYFAHGASQIQHYLENLQFDIILLDGDMPLMDGIDVVKEFLVERNIPVIIVSMNPIKADKMRFMLEEATVPALAIPICKPEKIAYHMRQILTPKSLSDF